MTKALYAVLFLISGCLICMSCSNQTSLKSKQPNDTLAIIQAVLDSKMLDSQFYYKDEVPQLYTRVKYRRRSDTATLHPLNIIDSVETLHLLDSFFVYKGRQIKLGDTAYDLDRQYKIPAGKYKFPNAPKADFVIGLGPVKKIEGNEAWFLLGIEESNIDITAHLKKINGKWEVVDYEWGQY